MAYNLIFSYAFLMKRMKLETEQRRAKAKQDKKLKMEKDKVDKFEKMTEKEKAEHADKIAKQLIEEEVIIMQATRCVNE